MPLDITRITRNRTLGAKAETTTGTAVTPVAADCALFSAIFDPKIAPSIPPNLRPGQQYLSPKKPIPGASAGKLTFRSEIFGSGTAATAPTWATVLFPACGCAVASGVVTPLSPSASQALATITAGIYQAGGLKLIAGAMGDFTIRGKAGGPLYVEWSFDGVWQSPATAAIPSSINYPSTVAPRFAGATFQLGSQALRVEEFVFKAGVKLYLRPDSNAVDGAGVGTGYRGATVVDREPTITLDPESLPLGTINWFAGHMATTTYAFTATAGSVAGNMFTLAAPAAQFLNPPQDKDRGGIMADDMELICTDSGIADGDWSATFG